MVLYIKRIEDLVIIADSRKNNETERCKTL